MTRMHTYLNFPGNAEEAFQFYQSVFGGEFSSHVRFGDLPMEGVDIPEGDRSKAMHIALPIGDTDLLMASDALQSLGQTLTPGNNVHVSIHPDTREEADRIFSALSAGGQIEMPIGDQVWGDYYGACSDKFGVHWMVNYSPQQS